jgi:hypothetical protein
MANPSNTSLPQRSSLYHMTQCFPDVNLRVAQNRVARGEKFLQSLVDRTALTETGKGWLIASVDPFHDLQIKTLEGWPDIESAASVVRCVKQSLSISKSTELAAGAWDMHVNVWPWFESIRMHAWNRLDPDMGGGRIIYQPQLDFNLGGLTVHETVAGADMDVTNPDELVGSLTLDPAITRGAGRIVGCGFEVINTTSELYKGGSCFAYRSPQSKSPPSTWVSLTSGGVPDLPFTAKMIRRPPLNTAEANLLAGTRQWNAAEGCYVVQTFIGQDNPSLIVDYTQPLVYWGDLEDRCGAGILNTDESYSPILGPFVQVTANDPSLSLLNNATKIYPINTGGCIFAGLTEQSTFTVNMNIYYESFPTPAEADIVMIATPSCPFDPVALEIYSRMLSDLPVGCPASDNPDGEWFNTIVSLVRDIAPVAAPFLAAVNPALGALAGGIGTAAGMYLAPPTSKTNPDREMRAMTQYQKDRGVAAVAKKAQTKRIPSFKETQQAKARKKKNRKRSTSL